MATTINAGSNATVAVAVGDRVTIEPKNGGAYRLENPSGTLVGEYADCRTFGPFRTARNIKITAVGRAVTYEDAVATPKTIAQDDASGISLYFGSGAPTISAGQGSLYLRSDGSSTSTRAYINTDGGTTWTALTTAA